MLRFKLNHVSIRGPWWPWHLNGRSCAIFWRIRMKQNYNVGHTYVYVAMETKIWLHFSVSSLTGDGNWGPFHMVVKLEDDLHLAINTIIFVLKTSAITSHCYFENSQSLIQDIVGIAGDDIRYVPIPALLTCWNPQLFKTEVTTSQQAMKSG